jgi:hypothetical protein
MIHFALLVIAAIFLITLAVELWPILLMIGLFLVGIVIVMLFVASLAGSSMVSLPSHITPAISILLIGSYLLYPLIKDWREEQAARKAKIITKEER